MRMQQVTDAAFKRYGRVIQGMDFRELVETLNKETPLQEEVVYEPSVAKLEELTIFEELKRRIYGELPIQIGYCNGRNYLLNALEYHRSSEINVAGTDAILLVGAQQDITEDFTYDTALVEAFLLPRGTAVEIYATTLHYAPCSVGDERFQVAIVLPKGTNLALEQEHSGWEDRLLVAKNKWLLGHPKGGLPADSPIGLVGKNVDCRN